jgi:hypothetical protein
MILRNATHGLGVALTVLIYLSVVCFAFSNLAVYDSIGRYGLAIFAVVGFIVLVVIIADPQKVTANLIAVGIALFVFYFFIPSF